ncbi:WhiB family transcriptional regulator [Pseudonocardia spinosispora]|uniref:WhiB family transcriptional regulator n=1 Tax=Pseudonocardia spinosispora TaxID=103441 RepID=UPI0003F9B4CB|nr:WhiB family transcriptional regulator [Pseudonocardia spinosispora]
MVANTNWRLSANCRNVDPDSLFVKGAKQRDARSICRGCPVLTQCLAQALDEKLEYGVWGGLTERERRAMLKQRPDVTCWSTFLTKAVAAQRAAKARPTQTPAAPTRHLELVARGDRQAVIVTAQAPAIEAA